MMTESLISPVQAHRVNEVSGHSPVLRGKGPEPLAKCLLMAKLDTGPLEFPCKIPIDDANIETFSALLSHTFTLKEKTKKNIPDKFHRIREER